MTSGGERGYITGYDLIKQCFKLVYNLSGGDSGESDRSNFDRMAGQESQKVTPVVLRPPQEGKKSQNSRF